LTLLVDAKKEKSRMRVFGVRAQIRQAYGWVFGVRAQIRQAYGLPFGGGASHRCEIGV